MLKKIGLSVLLLIAQNGAEAAVQDFTLHTLKILEAEHRVAKIFSPR